MQLEYIIPFLFPIFFIGLWVMVCLLLSTIGGWSRLAEHYRSPTDFTGNKWQFQSGRLGVVNYKSCLTLGTNDAGLYLAVFPFFRMGHPPLLIPWPDIRATESQDWLFSYRDFTFTKAPTIKLRVLRSIGNKIRPTQA